MLQAAFGERAVIGSDQFLYWEPSNPRACCAPDVMVRLGERDDEFDSWKVWERGAPQLAIELVSAADASTLSWAEKLDRYHHVGIVELVRFDREAEESPLRLWDNIDGDLVERDPSAPDFRRSDVLEAYWTLGHGAKGRHWLRLARDEAGAQPFLTPAEHAEIERQRAETRLAEVEAELARLKGQR